MDVRDRLRREVEGFNSTLVRFKQTDKAFQFSARQRFNSTLVRFKLVLTEHNMPD